VSLVEAARRIAAEVLFPVAAEVDRAPVLPAGLLDRLAGAGLYGAAAPGSVGGAALDGPAMGLVTEALAGGSLAPAFVWLQHHGLVRALADPAAPAALRDEWLPRLAAGTVKAGACYGGLVPGPARVRAVPNPGAGWLLSGDWSWVTGWGLVDVLHVAARTADDRLVWLLVDATERPGLAAERLRVVAADAASTVHLRFAGLPVPADRVLSVGPYEGQPQTGAGVRLNGSLALGVVGRCAALLGPGGVADELCAELTAARQALDDAVTAADPGAMPAARAAASELAVRAAAALATAQGAGSALAGSTAERLTREALFLLVFASRPAIRTALLDRLAGLG
jgi:alkylation response protein AidB-like acyl-CoA dehydrogenase